MQFWRGIQGLCCKMCNAHHGKVALFVPLCQQIMRYQFSPRNTFLQIRPAPLQAWWPQDKVMPLSLTPVNPNRRVTSRSCCCQWQTVLPPAETLLLALLPPKPSQEGLRGNELPHIATTDVVIFPWRYIGNRKKIGQKSELGQPVLEMKGALYRHSGKEEKYPHLKSEDLLQQPDQLSTYACPPPGSGTCGCSGNTWEGKCCVCHTKPRCSAAGAQRAEKCPFTATLLEVWFLKRASGKRSIEASFVA